MPAEARFDLPPRKALEFFQGKGYAVGFAWQDVWQYQHDEAFTVAKMMQVDLLKDVRAAVDKAISIILATVKASSCWYCHTSCQANPTA